MLQTGVGFADGNSCRIWPESQEQCVAGIVDEAMTR